MVSPMCSAHLTRTVNVKSGGPIPRENKHFGHPYNPDSSPRVRTNNVSLQTFTTNHVDTLVNITRNNDGPTVTDEGCESSFLSPTQSSLGKASQYDNIKNYPVFVFAGF
jgi:hypothetical protein